MTIDEMQQAMIRKLPVEYNGIRYARIEDYLFHIDERGVKKRSLNLVDGKNCLVRAPFESVKILSTE